LTPDPSRSKKDGWVAGADGGTGIAGVGADAGLDGGNAAGIPPVALNGVGLVWLSMNEPPKRLSSKPMITSNVGC
jgi:hypothetical protein